MNPISSLVRLSAVVVLLTVTLLGSPQAAHSQQPGCGTQVDVSVQDNTLWITGTDGVDSLRVRLDDSGNAVNVYEPATSTNAKWSNLGGFQQIQGRLCDGNDLLVLDNSGGKLSDKWPIHVEGNGGNDIVLGGIDLSVKSADVEMTLSDALQMIAALSQAQDLIDGALDLIEQSAGLVTGTSDVLRMSAEDLIVPTALYLGDVESQLVQPAAQKVREAHERLSLYVETTLAEDAPAAAEDAQVLQAAAETAIPEFEELLPEARLLLTRTEQLTQLSSQFGCEAGGPVREVSLNTGWNQASGRVIPSGNKDDDWMVVADPDPETPEPRPADVVTSSPWPAPQDNSQWISFRSSRVPVSPTPTEYSYQYCFYLAEGFSSAQMNLALWADDLVQAVLLNGVQIGGSGGNFGGEPLAVTTTDPTLLRPGRNCLTIIVRDDHLVITGLNLVGAVTVENNSCSVDELGSLTERLACCTQQFASVVTSHETTITTSDCPEDIEPGETENNEDGQDPTAPPLDPRCAELEQNIEGLEGYANSFYDDEVTSSSAQAAQIEAQGNDLAIEGGALEAKGEARGNDEDPNSEAAGLAQMGEDTVVSGDAFSAQADTVNADWEGWVSGTELDLGTAGDTMHARGQAEIFTAAEALRTDAQNRILTPAEALRLQAEQLQADLDALMAQAAPLLGSDGAVDQLAINAASCTITPTHTFKGDAGNDVLIGTSGSDRIEGGEGKDLLIGADGADELLGEKDRDLLFGAGGADVIRGGELVDILVGGGGDDCLFGGQGEEIGNSNLSVQLGDLFFGAGGNDKMVGAENETNPLNQVDLAWGGDGADDIRLNNGGTVQIGAFAFQLGNLVFAGGGNDTSLTTDGIDLIFGDAGEDAIKTGKGYKLEINSGGAAVFKLALGDLIFGGNDKDTVDADDPDADRKGDDIDVVFGGDGNDTIKAYAGGPMEIGSQDPFKLRFGNLVFGGAGNDNIQALDGIDVIFGDDGDDAIKTGKGYRLQIKDGSNTVVLEVPLGDLIFGDGGKDAIDADDPTSRKDDDIDVAFGGDGDDTIKVYGGGEIVIGSQDPFRLHLGNLVFGGADNDDVTALDGIDVVFGGDGNDTTKAGKGDLLEIGQDFSINFGDLIFGQEGNDTLHGDAKDPSSGDDGIDLVFGGAGNDSAYGGTGGTIKVGPDFCLLFGNLMFGGPGDDLLRGDYQSWSADEADRAGGVDLLFGGEGIDTIEGSQGGLFVAGQFPNAVVIAFGNLLFGGPDGDKIYGANRSKACGGFKLELETPEELDQFLQELQQLLDDVNQALDEISLKLEAIKNQISVLLALPNGPITQVTNLLNELETLLDVPVDQLDESEVLAKGTELVNEAKELVSETKKLINQGRDLISQARPVLDKISQKLNFSIDGVTRVLDHIESVLNRIETEYVQELERIVTEVEGYLQDVNGHVAELQQAVAEAQAIVDELQQAVEDLETLQEEAETMLNRLLKMAQQAIEDVQETVTEMKDQLQDVVEILSLMGAADLILAGAGDDSAQAYDGIDFVFGSAGDDLLEADHGGFIIVPISGVPAPIAFGNLMFGGNHDDTIKSKGRLVVPAVPPMEIDLLFGNECDDTIEAGDGLNIVFGNTNNDKISASDGVNLLFGNSASDKITTGSGLNIAFGNGGNDTVKGGPASGGAYMLFGNEGDDEIAGGAGLTLAFGNRGDDTVSGGAGVALLFGNRGSDDVKGGSGSVTLAFGNRGQDVVGGGDGLAVLFGNRDNDDVSCANGLCLAFGNQGHDAISAGNEVNLQFGNADDDRLTSGAGFSLLFGNGGNDVLQAGSGLLFAFGNDGDDVIAGGGNGLNLGFGNQGSDDFFGGDGAVNFFAGNRGNDQMVGGTGGDFLLGNSGFDKLVGGGGTDWIFGNRDDDALGSGGGGDFLFGNRGNDSVFSENDGGTDWLFGNRGNDTLDKCPSSDKAFGGRGKDNKTKNCAPVNISPPSRGEVRGRVLVDRDGNGGDVGLANVQISVGSRTTTTDEDGWFRVGGLSGGSYTVAQAVPTGYVPLPPGTSVNVSISSYGSARVDFVNRQLPGICGFKFHDRNGDEVWDSGEPGLAGWTITATALDGSPKGTAATDAYGHYCVLVPPGDYIVSETPQSNWDATTPTSVAVRLLPDNSLFELDDLQDTACPETFGDLDFGNHAQQPVEGQLCILKFHDLVANGSPEPEEPGIEGWTFDVSGLGQVTSGPDGWVCENVTAGTYTVSEQVPADWNPTTPPSQTASVEPEQQRSVAFGNVKEEAPAYICILKFHDLNGNGLAETHLNEPLLPGWTFQISGAGQATTGSNGQVCVQVTAGTHTVTEVVQPGWAVTTANPQTVTALPKWTHYLYFGNQVCVAPPPDMVAWWPLDEGTGTTTAEIVAGNTGTLTNGPTWLTPGHVANALTFHGANDYVQATNNAPDFGTGDFSIDAWVRTSSTAQAQMIVDKRTPIGPVIRGYALFLTGNRIALQLADGSAPGLNCTDSPTTSSCTNYGTPDLAALNDGNWHLVAVTVDRYAANGIAFYLDGGLVSTANPAARTGSLSSAGPFRIGSRSFGPDLQTFSGNIDEVELFNRVLSQEEVRAIFAAGTAGKCKPPAPPPTDTPTPTPTPTRIGQITVQPPPITPGPIATPTPTATPTATATPAPACTPLNVILNTGTTNGVPDPFGAVDPNWTVTEAPVSVSGQAFSIQPTSSAWVTSTVANWIDPFGGSGWDPPGWYTFQRQFVIDTSTHTNFALTLQFAADNAAQFTLNGNLPPAPTPTPTPFAGGGDFLSLSAPVTISTGFVNGTNTLTARVFNNPTSEGGNTPVGLLLIGSVTADCIGDPPAATPTPTSTPTSTSTSTPTPPPTATSTPTPTPGSVACVDRPEGMVAWWPLDEGTGTTTAEIVGGNTGTLTNGPTWLTPGHVANALTLHGVNDYVQATNNAPDFGIGDFSIDAWVRTSSTAQQFIVAKESKTGNLVRGYRLDLTTTSGSSGGRIRLGLADASAPGTNCSAPTSSCTNYESPLLPNLKNGQWHLVAVTVDRDVPNGIVFYLDGAVVGNANPTNRQGNLDNAGPFRIGSRSYGTDLTSFNGNIDEVELFNRSLSQEEIQAIFNAGAAGKCKP